MSINTRKLPSLLFPLARWVVYSSRYLFRLRRTETTTDYCDYVPGGTEATATFWCLISRKSPEGAGAFPAPILLVSFFFTMLNWSWTEFELLRKYLINIDNICIVGWILLWALSSVSEVAPADIIAVLQQRSPLAPPPKLRTRGSLPSFQSIGNSWLKYV